MLHRVIHILDEHLQVYYNLLHFTLHSLSFLYKNPYTYQISELSIEHLHDLEFNSIFSHSTDNLSELLFMILLTLHHLFHKVKILLHITSK